MHKLFVDFDKAYDSVRSIVQKSHFILCTYESSQAN